MFLTRVKGTWGGWIWITIIKKKFPKTYQWEFLPVGIFGWVWNFLFMSINKIKKNKKCSTILGETSFDVTLCPGGSEEHPCTEWGWRFYDGFDIEGNDLGKSDAGHRNDCQPICGGTQGTQTLSILINGNKTNLSTDRLIKWSKC